MMRRGWLVLGAVFITVSLHAEVAIIPYRVDNPSVNLPESAGADYARLIAIAAQLIKRRMEITPARDLELDLQRGKISTQRTITAEDLDHLGKTRQIDHFLLGTLGKSESGYFVESVLYSVKQRRAVVRIRARGDSLFQTAEREIRQAFADYRDQSGQDRVPSLDAAFVLDSSYRVNSDIADLKRAVSAFAEDCIDVRRIDSRFHVIPFSDASSKTDRFQAVSSLMSLKAELEGLRPAGGATGEHLARSLQHAIANIRWRADAVKLIVVIANSPLGRAPNTEKYALMARRKGIVISVISLGAMAGDDSNALDRLAEISGGTRLAAAYHQRSFNADAAPVDLYMERGRLFTARGDDGSWREGLYGAGRRGSPAKPRPFLNEVFYDAGKHAVTPYSMAKKYGEFSRERIINSRELESNLETIVRRMVNERISALRGDAARPMGKVLLAEGSISLWVPVTDERFMSFFTAQKESGFAVPLAVTIRRDPEGSHGITLVPRLTGIPDDSVPSMMRATLAAIVKNPEHYLSKGLINPPVWFVTVRVEEAENYRIKRDIRD